MVVGIVCHNLPFVVAVFRNPMLLVVLEVVVDGKGEYGGVVVIIVNAIDEMVGVAASHLVDIKLELVGVGD